MATFALNRETVPLDKPDKVAACSRDVYWQVEFNVRAGCCRLNSLRKLGGNRIRERGNRSISSDRIALSVNH